MTSEGGMLRYVETWYRLRWLWLVYLVLVGLIIYQAVRTHRPEYEAVARVWVNPTVIQLLSPKTFGLPGVTRYAPYQVATLRDLMLTETFVTRVTTNTALRQVQETPEGRRTVRTYLINSMTIKSLGNNLFELRFVADPPELAFQLLRASVSALREMMAEADRGQADLTLQTYRPEIAQAERAWQEAAAELRQFVLSSPVIQANEGPVSALPVDLQVELDLRRAKEISAREQLEQLVGKADQIKSWSAATGTGWRASTALIDGPVMDSEPRPMWMTLGIRVICLVAIGLIAIVATVLLVTWTDLSVRRMAETEQRFGLPVLGVLPRQRRGRGSSARPKGRRPSPLLAS